ncbi:hypothetical protein SMICM304S_00741 [Streptomyces microflavus]
MKGLRRARIELPGIESSSLPSSVRNFNRSELPVRGKLLDLVWEDGKLVVKGYAYVPNVPSATGKRSLRVAVLRRQGSRSALPLRLRTVEEPRATTEAKGALHNYDWSGFEIGIDPGRLRVRGQWQSGTWRLGVAPNAFTTPIMTNSFRLQCEVLEAGYPRNDVFHAPDRVKRAAAVREKLGIPAGKKVVLYAPTWRDDQRYGGRRFKLDNQIDVEAARRELGEDHVLLYRKHHKVLDSIPGAGQGFVYDVTYYPDIADLYLIADVLITDYSSVLFDFAHSGRPMLFFTYDLEHYRDTLRGFYFDFTSRAPGPLIKTSEDLVAAIRNIDEVSEEYKEKYAQFRVDFCEPSDGRAAARVVDRMLAIKDEQQG